MGIIYSEGEGYRDFLEYIHKRECNKERPAGSTRKNYVSDNEGSIRIDKLIWAFLSINIKKSSDGGIFIKTVLRLYDKQLSVLMERKTPIYNCPPRHIGKCLIYQIIGKTTLRDLFARCPIYDNNDDILDYFEMLVLPENYILYENQDDIVKAYLKPNFKEISE